ncbi:transcription factor bHLH18 isoform X1 [Brachypodium distachyon]|uniref:BHLH domain-containing protein n=2 Tax=Brachypodium distachyon TaxID=15368 RepID=I1I331_BRADI|nr:transcription factor bHLH18 isoform X1 [Brachypodium distachyon]XP_024318241.1 transcription factor bHLH18 isoform X1 [Brachypodium distachyon]XP_024318242.1 transcription factor bHLH18 isoform X1 [Brachypodium distachyon]KQJ96187.1 hypothetical protein BRADI_3g21460v3 [Brachypodium distachyon]PNT67139.1 hypothetical protein BRADI_3g21460v3 [Brachypodium distachyon]|eukprot:XP_024318240.1 transcription factor bHLH18 isoform X1 [Brachypodium distachyon]
MDSSSNQWLTELENVELVENLDLVDEISMQQLAESLAEELIPRDDQPHHKSLMPSLAAGIPFTGGFNNSTESFPTGANSVFSFSDGSSVSSLNFSTPLEPPTTGGSYYCPSPSSEKRLSGRRTSLSIQEHVASERRRREKMHHQFATLASIIPDIAKTDKVSLLGSAIQYVHKLEEKLKALKEHQSTVSTAESAPMFDVHCCIGNTGDGKEDDCEKGENSSVRPKIEVNVRGTTVLLQIACREKKGVLIMVLTELEKHGLSIMNTSVVPFGDDDLSSLNIIITAEIENGSCTTAELLKNLNLAIRNF